MKGREKVRSHEATIMGRAVSFETYWLPGDETWDRGWYYRYDGKPAIMQGGAYKTRWLAKRGAISDIKRAM